METMKRRRELKVMERLQQPSKIGIGSMLLLAICVLMWSAQPAFAKIRFRSGPIVPKGKTPKEVRSAVIQLAERPDQHHIVVQFSHPVKTNHKAALRHAGIETLSYLGDNAFFASIAARGVNAEAVAKTLGITEIRAIDRVWKIHPAISSNVIPDHAIIDDKNPKNPIVAVYLLFHQDVDLATTGVNTARAHGAVIVDQLKAVNGFVIELPWADIAGLADEDVVQWIEWPLPRMSEINDSNRIITGADDVQELPYGLDGSGVTVLVYDGGTARASHIDFGGRLTVHDSSGMHYHSTHVAGTIGGDGSASNGAFKGMAPGVNMVSYGFEYDESGILLYSNPGDIESDYNEAVNTYGAHISNNSIGTNTEVNGFDCYIQGDYGVTSQLIDTIVRGDGSNSLFTKPFRIVWANGNERQGSRCDVEGYGAYYSTAPPAGAKNHIAVGALNSNDDSMTSFSSWGPVDDGRIKPDVSAPGCQSDGDGGVTSTDSTSDSSYKALCGTSMAAPTVCGLSALLLQDYRAQFSGKPDPRNSTLKILLAHNAEDLGNTGPDYQYGYGSVRIQQTVDFMRTGVFLENQVEQGDTFSVSVFVSPGDSELKVTLAWDDYPGTPNVDPALVNDLDLRVFAPNSQQYYPWTLDQYNPSAPAVKTREDHVNNIEQVLVDNPTEGVWRIEVHGYNIPQGPQPFSICASPELIACSSTGTIELDAPKYPIQATAKIRVNDCDLNTDNNSVQIVTVTIKSTDEPNGEEVLLTETGAETADFRGAIQLDTDNSSGVLQVADGSTVTATYIDADDGLGGNSVIVTDTALVDNTPPLISNVQTPEIGPFSAKVTFDTNEPANSEVHYGLSCGAPTETAVETGYNTVHAFNLTGLTENTEYFYVVNSADEAANDTTDDNDGDCYTFTTPNLPDYFTEIFGYNNDLDNLSLTFTLDGSYDSYSACPLSISDLPVDPNGGTILDLSDDSFAMVTLSDGKTVSLYGINYNTFYVGSNGYITFMAGDRDHTESLADHFDLPRISLLFDDLDPYSVGTVSWKQLADRAVVTWAGVPQFGYTDPTNTFQVEMHFDGTIVISYLTVAAEDGLAGLSEGKGEPVDFNISDLSEYVSCTCEKSDDCDDGLFCNGIEICTIYKICQSGNDPCPGQGCDEDNNVCVDCGDSICESGEDCNNCPNDCFTGPGGSCGNGICETVDGEDCLSCPDDCNGNLGGKPSKRYCCGDGSAQYGVTCSDGRCTGDGNTCMNHPAASCCGDGSCDGSEDSSNCEVDCDAPSNCGNNNCDSEEDQCICPGDCGTPPATEMNCTDGIDNDCDGFTDGNDPDCVCSPRGTSCTADENCCSNWCHKGACK